ncbi:MAG: recombinase family protein [Acidimicrobiales bacterium]
MSAEIAEPISANSITLGPKSMLVDVSFSTGNNPAVVPCYVRFSTTDGDNKTKRSVERQRDDIIVGTRDMLPDYLSARNLGHDGYVLRFYVDDDLSGSNPAVVRPAFDRLRSDIASDAFISVGLVVTWKVSRLSRQAAQIIDFSQTAWRHRVANVFTTSGRGKSWSLAPGGPIHEFQTEGIRASLEAEQLGQDIRDQRMQAENDGIFTGAFPLWGYVRYRNDSDLTTSENRAKREACGGIVVDESRRAAATEIYRRVIDGRSLGAIAQWLNAEGETDRSFLTLRGGHWTGGAIRQWLTCWTQIGCNNHIVADEHTGERPMNRRTNARPTPGRWEPLVTPETRLAALAMIGKRTEVVDANGRTRVRIGSRNRPDQRHLLTNRFAFCGVCGQAMSVTSRERFVPARLRGTVPPARSVGLLCSDRTGRPGCGNRIIGLHDEVFADGVETIGITRAVVTFLFDQIGDISAEALAESRDNAAAAAALDDVRRRQQSIDERMSMLVDQLGSARSAALSDRIRAALSDLDAQAAELEATAARLRSGLDSPAPSSATISALESVDAFWSAPIKRQAEAMRIVLSAVVIDPPTRRGRVPRGADMDRVRIFWATAADRAELAELAERRGFALAL